MKKLLFYYILLKTLFQVYFCVRRKKMKISAVISEFNPFHNGHLHLINKARESGSTHIVSIMSGNYVQRGDCAVYSKWDRGMVAVKNGVDLVIEIPTVWSVSSASNFAFAGVSIAEKCGCIDELFFGSECNDISSLKKIIAIINSDEYKEEFNKVYMSGLSYPLSRKKSFQNLGYSELSEILDNSNDILAVEYISSLNKIKSKITPVSFKRIGAHHDCDEYNNVSNSASYIRNKILNGEIQNQFEIHRITNIEKAILVKLKSMNADEIKKICDIDEGLENRIFKAVEQYNCLKDVIEYIKSKRYTLSRIRRIIINCLLDIKKDDVYSDIPYIKVICFNEKGREILKKMKDTATLPIIMKSSDIYKTNDNHAIEIYNKEIVASDIYSLCCDKNELFAKEQKSNAFLI